MQPLRKDFLVVADDRHVVGGNHVAHPDRRRHLAVREVMHDLARGPLARRRPRVELRIGGPGNRVRHRAIALFVLRDELFPCLEVHALRILR